MITALSNDPKQWSKLWAVGDHMVEVEKWFKIGQKMSGVDISTCHIPSIVLSKWIYMPLRPFSWLCHNAVQYYYICYAELLSDIMNSLPCMKAIRCNRCSLHGCATKTTLSSSQQKSSNSIQVAKAVRIKLHSLCDVNFLCDYNKRCFTCWLSVLCV